MKFKNNDIIEYDTVEEMIALLYHLDNMGYDILDWEEKREYNHFTWDSYFRKWDGIRFNDEYFSGTCNIGPNDNIYRGIDVLGGNLKYTRDTVGNQKLKFLWP